MAMQCIVDTSAGRCPRQAVMAVATSRRQGDLQTTVYYDEVFAPTKADRLCREHGLALVQDLIKTMVPEGAVAF